MLQNLFQNKLLDFGIAAQLCPVLLGDVHPLGLFHQLFHVGRYQRHREELHRIGEDADVVHHRTSLEDRLNFAQCDVLAVLVFNQILLTIDDAQFTGREIDFTDVSGAEPALSVLLVKVAGCQFSLFVVAFSHVITTDMDLSSWMEAACHAVIALFPVDQFDGGTSGGDAGGTGGTVRLGHHASGGARFRQSEPVVDGTAENGADESVRLRRQGSSTANKVFDSATEDGRHFAFQKDLVQDGRRVAQSSPVVLVVDEELEEGAEEFRTTFDVLLDRFEETFVDERN